MRKILFIMILAACSLTNADASNAKYNNDSLIAVLDDIIDHKDVYEQKKRQSIERHLYRYSNAITDKDLFHECSALLEKYKKYRLDSVLYYARKKLAIAQRLGNPDSIALSIMNEADGLKGLGRFNDAQNLLNSIPKTEYVRHSEYFYYLLNSTMLSLSAEAVTDAEKKAYSLKLRQYRDSIASVISPSSVGAFVNQAEILKMNGKFREAAALLESIQAKAKLEIDENAIYWVSLAEIYQLIGNTEGQKYCLIRASIIDNRNCVKTYTSLQSLAILLHDEGDIDHAYKYITRALDDIISSNARSRLVQVAEYMPIITAAHAQQEKRYTHATLHTSRS